MARLLRSYGVSKLRPPVTVGASVTFRPLEVTLSVTLGRRGTPLQRAVRSDLQPPAKVGPPVTFRPSQINRAASTRLGRAPHSRAIKPAVVSSSVTFGPVTIKLAASSRLARATHSFRTALPPAPVVVVADLLIPTRIVRAISSRLGRRPRSVEIAPPAIVGAPITYPPVRIELAALLRAVRYRRTRSFSTPIPLFPVVPPPTLEQLKTRIFLTRRGPVRLTKSKLKPPAVTAPSLVFAPIDLELAPSSRLARATHPRLKPPAVIAYPVTAEQRYVNLYLAPSSKLGRRPMWQLHPPAAIIAQIPPLYLEGNPGGPGSDARGGIIAPEGNAGIVSPEAGDGSSFFEGNPGLTGAAT